VLQFLVVCLFYGLQPLPYISCTSTPPQTPGNATWSSSLTFARFRSEQVKEAIELASCWELEQEKGRAEKKQRRTAARDERLPAPILLSGARARIGQEVKISCTGPVLRLGEATRRSRRS
jgi:hypothetical protein